MANLVSVIIAYLVNALWLLPVLVLAAEATTRLLGGMRASLLHRIWLGCLLLSLAAPALSFLAGSFLRPAWVGTQATLSHSMTALERIQPHPLSAAPPSVSFVQPVRPANGPLHLPARLAEALCILYLGSILFALLRLAGGLGRTRSLLRDARTAALTDEVWAEWRSCLAVFGVAAIELLTSHRLTSPATVHWPRPVVILPEQMRPFEAGEMETAFCHELAHIRRRDFLFNLFYESLAVLLFFHPALHWMRRRIQETRELACDDLAAAAIGGRVAYAQNLLRLTETFRCIPELPQPTCALGIFEGEILEKRIMNLIEKKSRLPRLRLGLSIALGACLLLAACALSANFGLSPLWAQAVADHAPSGWFMAGSKPASYHTGVDKEAVHDGQPSAYLQSAVAKTEGFGTLMQTIDASEYAGKRVRLRAAVKSDAVKDWAGLWMRVDSGQNMAVSFDNMQNRAIKGTQPWSSYDVVLDVPADATSISFGLLLNGEGQVWMNHVEFEAVGAEIEVTSPKTVKPSLSKKPVNLSFSE